MPVSSSSLPEQTSHHIVHTNKDCSVNSNPAMKQERTSHTISHWWWFDEAHSSQKQVWFPLKIFVLQTDPKCQPRFQVLFTTTTATLWQNKARGGPAELQAFDLWNNLHWYRACHCHFKEHNDNYARASPPLTQGGLHSLKPRAYLSPQILHLPITPYCKWRRRPCLPRSLCFPHTCLTHGRHPNIGWILSLQSHFSQLISYLHFGALTV